MTANAALYYFKRRDGIANFGDDLNPMFFGRLLGVDVPVVQQPSDAEGRRVVVGIGSLLNSQTVQRLQGAREVRVFGSGVGYGDASSLVLPANWQVQFVRGPRSAASLGLTPELGITDAAMLWVRLANVERQTDARIGYMPHVETLLLDPEGWRSVAEAEGITLLDPRDEPTEILGMMRRCRLLITEAMHGAILADAIGVPWHAIATPTTHRFKWQDWCLSRGLHFVPAATLPLLYTPREEALLPRVRRAVKLRIVSRTLRSLMRRPDALLSDRASLAAQLDRLGNEADRLREWVLSPSL